MKILFICGSLEPGRDGVGDYTRRLALELQHQGHQIYAVAFNDYNITGITYQRQLAIDGSLEVLRLPAVMNMGERVGELKKLINIFHPEWISLQYVPYAFHEKGLPFYLYKLLPELGKGRRWHIMLHETWASRSGKGFLKQLFLELLQRRVLKYLVQTLKPKVMHTHLPAYYQEVRRLGFRVSELPLFSNVPIIKNEPCRHEQNTFRVGLFSQVDISESIIVFLVKLAQKVESSGCKLELLVIGGRNEHIKKFKCTIEQLDCFKSRIHCAGFLNEKELSSNLQCCTIGLTPIPRHALGKSGSVTAFIAHSIPVAAPNIHLNFPSDAIGFFSPSLSSSIILEPDLSLIEKAKRAAMKASDEINISTITKRFIADLQ